MKSHRARPRCGPDGGIAPSARLALAHCAGKGAVLAMSRRLAMEGGPLGIRVDTISPALVQTAATKHPIENIPGFASTCGRSS